LAPMNKRSLAGGQPEQYRNAKAPTPPSRTLVFYEQPFFHTMTDSLLLWCNKIASLVCHQIPERTILIQGSLLPFCARCTGIYTGFLIGTVYQYICWRTRIKELPVLKISLLSMLFLLLLIVESVGSYKGFWSSPTHIRLLAGMLGGSSIAIFLLPVFNAFFFKKGRENERGITQWKEYASLIAIVCIVSLLITADIRGLFWIVAEGSILGVLVLYGMIGTTLLLSFWQKRHNDIVQKGKKRKRQ